MYFLVLSEGVILTLWALLILSLEFDAIVDMHLVGPVPVS